MKLKTLIGGAVAFASSVHCVQNATFCTDSNSICYTVNVPASTASNGGTGDLFFQISGPSSMRWIGFGQSQSGQMQGANMFVIYADAAGTNVTLSPRHGTGEVMPMEDTTTNVTLLGGSGIANGMMVANVLCTSCNSWTGGSTMNFDNTGAGFIWSYLKGDPISSNDLGATITQHDLMGTATFDLATAAGGSSSNPFVTTADASSPGGPGSGGFPGPIGGGGGGSTGTSGGDSVVDGPHWNKILKAHGIIGPLVFAVLFPIGAIMIRLLNFRGLVYLHAAWQFIALLLALSTLGLGIWLARTEDYIHMSHPIIGIVAIAAVTIQPITGLAHHLLFRRTGRANIATYPHVWWGRAAITLGIINGGLGLQLSDNTTGGKIAYGVVAGVMWVTWMTISLFAMFRRHPNAAGEKGVNSPAVNSADGSPNAGGGRRMGYK